ncbi:MAG: cytochrome c oxidase subunit II [Chloroflexota bacterium]
MPLVGLRLRRTKVVRARNWPSLAFATAIAVLVAACAGAAGNRGPEPGYGPGGPPPGFFPLQPVSQQGQYVFDFYPVIFWIAVAVFILVEGLLIWIVLRYRRRATDTELPTQTHGHNLLEIVWTLIPTLIVTGMFAFTVDTLGKVETANTAGVTPAVTVDVTGFQWQWTFEYPEEGIKLSGTGREGPTMALPVDETVRIRLHATDVIHSFYVPQFLYKKDVIPGRVNEFDVLIKQAGTFAGQCAEFCGLGHADMHFKVQAMSRAEFDAWVLQQQNPPSPDPSALPSGAPAVNVTSVGIAEGFDPTELSVAADTPWSVSLTNSDAFIPHNFSIYDVDPEGTDWVGQPNAEGGGSAVYQPPPLAAGDYQFYCSLHPNMVGNLRVGQ